MYIFTNSSRFISEPDSDAVTVGNITYTMLNTSTSDKFDYEISWKKPLFKESNVTKYVVKYTRTGNPDRKQQWEIKTVGLVY